MRNRSQYRSAMSDVAVDPDEDGIITAIASTFKVHPREIVFQLVVAGLESFVAQPLTEAEVRWYADVAAGRLRMEFVPQSSVQARMQAAVNGTSLSVRALASIACRRGLPRLFTADQLNEARQAARRSVQHAG